jgi:uncharacterized protein (TIGR03435 family)
MMDAMKMRRLGLSVAFMVCGLGATRGICQTAAPGPVFDVSTVKPSHATDGHTHLYRHPDDGGFEAINISLKGLLGFAYDLPETRVIGGPAWLDSEKWDIQAKSSAEVDAAIHKLGGGDASRAEKQHMVQALLAERFKLTAHQETRELPVYALVVAKGGPKFQKTEANGTDIGTGNSHIKIHGGDSVEILAEQLAKVLGRVVLDRTGILGRYDISLRWTPENGQPDKVNGASSPEETNGPSIFTAVQEQLGLRLDAQKGPVGVLVVDGVEMPTEN